MAGDLSVKDIQLLAPEIENALLQLTETRDSITHTAAKLISNIGHATKIVSIWYNEFKTVSSSKHVAFIYLANEIIQTSFHRDSDLFVDLFDEILPFICYRIFRAQDDRTIKKTKNVLETLRTRQILSEKSITMLIDCLEGKQTEVAMVIDIQGDIPEMILQDVVARRSPLRKQMSKSKILDEEAEAELRIESEDDRFKEIYKAGWSMNSMQDVEEMMSKVVEVVPEDTVVLPSKHAEVIEQQEQEITSGVSESMHMEEIEKQTKNLEEILKHHGNGESDAPNKSLHSKAEELGEDLVSMGTDQTAQYVTKQVEEHLSVDLNHFLSLIDKYTSVITESMDRRDNLLQNYVSILEEIRQEKETKRRKTDEMLATYSEYKALQETLRTQIELKAAGEPVEDSERRKEEILSRALSAVEARIDGRK